MNTEQLKTAEQIYEDNVGSNMELGYIRTPKENVIQAMEIFASQESKIAVSELKEKLKGEIERVRDLSVGDPVITSAYDNCIKLIDLIDKL